jgi:hypothetical protein
MSSNRVPNFEAEIFNVTRDAARRVVDSGSATLEEGEDEGGHFLRLTPSSPRACELTVYADYPTLCMGPGGSCTEMFGPEAQRLRELPQLVRAVIAGDFEWEHRQARFLWLFPYTQLRGTFHTEEGPWTFTRQGKEPKGTVAHGSYEPY